MSLTQSSCSHALWFILLYTITDSQTTWIEYSTLLSAHSAADQILQNGMRTQLQIHGSTAPLMLPYSSWVYSSSNCYDITTKPTSLSMDYCWITNYYWKLNNDQWKPYKPINQPSNHCILPIYTNLHGHIGPTASRQSISLQIIHPFGYSCGDHDLTRGIISLTYKYFLIHA